MRVAFDASNSDQDQSLFNTSNKKDKKYIKIRAIQDDKLLYIHEQAISLQKVNSHSNYKILYKFISNKNFNEYEMF